MINLQFGVVAQHAVVDRLTNFLSIFNVYERIEVQRFPILVPEIVFIVVLRRESADQATFDTILSIRLGQTVIGQGNMHVTFGNLMTTRHFAKFQGLPIMAAGDLNFSFTLPNAGTISASVPVVQAPVPAPQVVTS